MNLSFYRFEQYRFYFPLLIFISAGGALALLTTPSESHRTLCLFRNITGIPCPGCGVGRGIHELLQFNIAEAFFMNPFSIIIFFSAIILFLWALVDVLSNKASLYLYLKSIDKKVNRNKFAMAMLALVVLINWCWNILKFT